MYRNLEAEMTRQSVTKKDIADCLGVGYGTILVKFQGKYRFYFDEAMKIKENFFPDCSLEYLFNFDVQQKAAE